MGYVDTLDRADSLDWQDQHELDCAMSMEALASAVSSGCECADCLALGQWVRTPVAVPDRALTHYSALAAEATEPAPFTRAEIMEARRQNRRAMVQLKDMAGEWNDVWGDAR